MRGVDPVLGVAPAEAVYVPLVADPALRSDSPILADMLLEKGTPWREAAGFMLPRVSIRMADGTERAPGGALLPALEGRVIDPVTPPWIRMRERYRSGELVLDPAARLKQVTE